MNLMETGQRPQQYHHRGGCLERTGAEWVVRPSLSPQAVNGGEQAGGMGLQVGDLLLAKPIQGGAPAGAPTQMIGSCSPLVRGRMSKPSGPHPRIP